MEASARASVTSLADRIEQSWAAVSWRRILDVSTAAAVIAWAVAVALPRYMLAGDLNREIERLAMRTAQVSDDRMPAARPLSTETRNESERVIEPADLLSAATAAGRRAGLQLAAAKQMPAQSASDRTRRVRLHATASFEQIVGFLDTIVAMSPTLRVDALNILRPAVPGAGPVRLDLECTLSVEPRTPAQAAAPAAEKAK